MVSVELADKEHGSFGSVFCHLVRFFCATSTPDLPDTQISRLSAARTPCTVSPAKSNNPGVSIRLILVLPQANGAIEVETDTWRLISSGSKSQTVFPSEIFPNLSLALL